MTKPVVIARIRPVSLHQISSLGVRGDDVLVASGSVSLQFAHTSVLNDDTQQEMYKQVAPTVQASLQGYNATVLAYGQTGSGKTWSLVGDPAGNSSLQGIIPRALTDLGDEMALDSSLSIRISMVEIYCEQFHDLLGSRASSEDLSVQRHPVHGCAFVAGAATFPVQNSEDMMQLFNTGIAKRVVQSTGMNATSSRSHLVLSLDLQRTRPDGSTVHSKLCLVDLAGSERHSKTQASGACLAEGCAINRSLSALSNVISALSEGKRGAHIPYRDSKLTRLLQDCLGGNALMALIICLNPDSAQLTETMSTLRFGQRAMGVTGTAQINARATPASGAGEKAALQEKVAELEAALKDLQTRAEEPAEVAVLDDDAACTMSAVHASTDAGGSGWAWGIVLLQSALLTAWLSVRVLTDWQTVADLF